MSPGLADADLPSRYGARFFTEGVPEREFPDEGMRPQDAYQLLVEELELDGDPSRNLATFVTTWMEPPAHKMISDNLHRNFIDHPEYPRTAEIERRSSSGRFELIGEGEPQLPLVCFRLRGDNAYDEVDVAAQLAAERGWMVPAYNLPPKAQEIKVMRALVKENVSHTGARTLADDLAKACDTLDTKGKLHEQDRRRVKRNIGGY